MAQEESSDIGWPALLSEQIDANARLFFGLAHRILRDAHAAEDACQQACLRAWERREQLRHPAQLKAWLTRAVVNQSLEMLRRTRIEQRVLDDRARQSMAVSPGPDESGLAITEERDGILLALDRLVEMQRAVVVLRVMQGLSGNQTAQLLDCSEGEVSKQLHRGLDQLRVLLTGSKAE